MAPDSVSFRITRNTEDLAQTIHALSQRLVQMEQRLQAMELQLQNRLRQDLETEGLEVSSLENVERLLNDCRALLGLETEAPSCTLETTADPIMVSASEPPALESGFEEPSVDHLPQAA